MRPLDQTAKTFCRDYEPLPLAHGTTEGRRMGANLHVWPMPFAGQQRYMCRQRLAHHTCCGAKATGFNPGAFGINHLFYAGWLYHSREQAGH